MGTGIWCMTGKSDGVERVVWYVGAVRICEIVGTVCKLQVQIAIFPRFCGIPGNYSEIEKKGEKSGNEHILPAIQGKYRENIALWFVP